MKKRTIGSIRSGSRGGKYTISASGKKTYLGKTPNKNTSLTATHQPEKKIFFTPERKAMLLKGGILALSAIAAGAAAHSVIKGHQRSVRHSRLPDYRGPASETARKAYSSMKNPDWHDRGLKTKYWHDSTPDWHKRHKNERT